MLVLSRREGEEVRIGDGIKVQVVEIKPGGRVLLGFDAPKDVPIHREEVHQRILRQEKE